MRFCRAIISNILRFGTFLVFFNYALLGCDDHTVLIEVLVPRTTTQIFNLRWYCVQILLCHHHQFSFTWTSRIRRPHLLAIDIDIPHIQRYTFICQILIQINQLLYTLLLLLNNIFKTLFMVWIAHYITLWYPYGIMLVSTYWWFMLEISIWF